MIYCTGDIHGRVRRIIDFIREQGLSPQDGIVILGDAGLNFYGPGHGDERNKRRLNQAGVPILCIHGNHEMRPETLPDYREIRWRGGSVYAEADFPNLLFAKDGEVYDLDGVSAIAVGGAYSVDKPHRLAVGKSWFPDEQPSPEIKRRTEAQLDTLGWQVDVVLSHTCPERYIPTEAFHPGVDQSTVDQSTEQWLGTLEARLAYRAWFCGHWHINNTVDRMHFLFEEFFPLSEIKP